MSGKIETSDDLFPYADEAADYLATALQQVRRAKDITREAGTRYTEREAAELGRLMEEAGKAAFNAVLAINTLRDQVKP